VILSGSDRRLIVLSKSLRHDLVLDQTPSPFSEKHTVDLTLGPSSGLSVIGQVSVDQTWPGFRPNPGSVHHN
jgi:hypothetical protein